jgi:hypothetical protein
MLLNEHKGLMKQISHFTSIPIVPNNVLTVTKDPKCMIGTAELARLTGRSQRDIRRKARELPGRVIKRSGRDIYLFENGPWIERWIRNNTLAPSARRRRGRKGRASLSKSSIGYLELQSIEDAARNLSNQFKSIDIDSISSENRDWLKKALKSTCKTLGSICNRL